MIKNKIFFLPEFKNSTERATRQQQLVQKPRWSDETNHELILLISQGNVYCEMGSSEMYLKYVILPIG